MPVNMSADTLRVNAVVNNQDLLPFDPVYPVIQDPTWLLSDALRALDNSALGVLIHGLDQGIPVGPLACMLVGLDTNGALIAAAGAVKAFAIFGMDLKWDYFQTPGIKSIMSVGPHAPADGFPVHYGGGRAIINRYMVKGEGGAVLTYVAGDFLYRSTTAMLTKDSATDTTIVGQVLRIFPDGRLDCKFMI